MGESSIAFLGYGEAAEAARETRQWLILDFTAEWCAPCKHMERSVWPAREVSQWFDKHGLAARIDIDRQPELAKQFGVRSVPTLVAIRHEVEVDRLVGARSVSELLEWLQGLEVGRTKEDRVQMATKGDDLQARYQLALKALMSGDHTRALPEFLWLWSNALQVDPSWLGVRYSFLLANIAQLMRAHDPAREQFTGLRNALLEAPANSQQRSDWLALNKALGEEELSVAWFDTLPRPLPPDGARSLEQWFAEPLRTRGRWADLALLYPDAIRALEERHSLTELTLGDVQREQPDPQQQEDLQEYFKTALREHAALLVRACEASGRSSDAARVRTRAIELDPTDAMRTALDIRP